MLDIIYFSNITNTTHRFVSKLDHKANFHRIPIKGDYPYCILNSYILVVPSYGDRGHGHLPPQVRKFLAVEEFRKMCVGVVGTGSRNFGSEYNMAAKLIAKKLDVPLLHALELAGNEEDVQKVERELMKFETQAQHVEIN